MKPMKTVAALLILLTVFASCKKEVQIDLQSKESKLVIEADFAADKKVNTVYLTKTREVYGTGRFPEVSKARVVVSDNAEYSEVLSETAPGVYQTKSFSGKVGSTYFLTVMYENKTFEASGTLQPLVKLDTAFAITADFGGMKMNGFIPVYTDPAGVKNNYRFIEYVNGVRVKGSIVNNDEFKDGLAQQEPLFIMDAVMKPGDCLEVEMQMIDDASYLYFSSKDKTTGLESATPANPVSNFSGGALGYFNVHSTQYAKMLVFE
jgi:hypothetical protein